MLKTMKLVSMKTNVNIKWNSFITLTHLNQTTEDPFHFNTRHVR